jgi:hypothetical protein
MQNIDTGLEILQKLSSKNIKTRILELKESDDEKVRGEFALIKQMYINALEYDDNSCKVYAIIDSGENTTVPNTV